ncbi:pyridoxamine 5'-phosphate oxidase family protein [Streptomyces sp. NPDC051920]|uniref:pyridoxamine 5'-phosphate oxidase family protein n=1 Tax=Streptomyces sp. NPDC051920 TaxID=3155523 RepID=UPI00341D6A8D
MTYHSGSRTIQDRVGVRDLADHVGRAVGQGIRPVAAAFLELQPMLIVGAAAPDGGTRREDEPGPAGGGAVWASLLTGEPGFVRATGARQISVVGGLPAGDPLTAALAVPGTAVGTIALDPRTRRRMRLDGRVRPTPRGFAVEADQVFANCPKYLQQRQTYEKVTGRTPGVPRRGTELTPSQREFVTAADTFFVATVHAHGADASHRGGNPGFVRVDTPRELSWPDYPGNSMFLTLGNLTADPRAGLLFLDWTSGSVLQLTGTARTEFAPDGERTVRFTLSEAVETPAASPLRWSAPAYSPANP